MNKARKHFTQILLVAVSALGLLSAALMLSDPPATAWVLGQSATLTSSGSGSGAVSGRNPASAEATKNPAEDPLLELNCGELNQVLETSSARFRLKGAFCLPEEEGTNFSAQVKNKSNGYVATVFHRSSQFTTDYINLKDGKNEIDVLFQTTKESIQKTITVVRSNSRPATL